MSERKEITRYIYKDKKQRDECVKMNLDHSCRVYWRNTEESNQQQINKGIRELIRLREDGIIDEKQFMLVLKYLVAEFVENKVIQKVETALEKSIFSRSLS